jgi:holo-[acyl-carrier protein] synthase|tara:strand:+ start:7471 stop:7857 length:387 start_codon:yes stop_codon:yes gene_type:complete
MKIYGIGVDLIKIKRIKKLLKSKKNSKKRLFTIHENKISRRIRNKEMYFAKRFAAKEAFSKALGTGISDGLNFNEIETFSNNKGKPSLKILGKSRIIVKKILKNKRYTIYLSLSDEKTYAIAFVVIAL